MKKLLMVPAVLAVFALVSNSLPASAYHAHWHWVHHHWVWY
jgi:hypothetical protein